MEKIKKLSSELNFLKEVDRIKARVDEARPFDEIMENKIIQKLRLDWNYNSNAIEGNSFTKGETIALIMEGLTAKGKPFKDALDINGHNNAIDLIMSMIRNERPLNEADIRSLHKILLGEDYYTPAQTEDGLQTRKLIKIGQYKASPNHVKTATGETHYYVSPEDTPAKMNELIDWYNEVTNSNDFHPIVLASLFHHKFVAIHPFDDGNGRMARLLTNLILLKYNYPICVIKNENKLDYFSRLSEADQGNDLPIIEFIAIAVNNSLDLYLRAIDGQEINDEKDLDRQIALFMQELNLTNERVTTRDSETMCRIAFKLFKSIKTKLDKFQPAFQQYQEIIYNVRNKANNRTSNWGFTLSNEMNSLEEFRSKVEPYITKSNDITYYYNLLQDVKRNKENIKISIDIVFYNKTYEVLYKNETYINKCYGDKIIDSSALELISSIIVNVQDNIKLILED